jgi:hypothetical protein
MKRITLTTKLPKNPVIGFWIRDQGKGYVHFLWYRDTEWKAYALDGVNAGNGFDMGANMEDLRRWLMATRGDDYYGIDNTKNFRAYLFKSPRALFAWLGKP